MTTDENAAPTPTRAQAEKAVSAMLDVREARENLVTRLKVVHYATWRARFDEMRGSRAAAGIANAKVFLGGEDTVVVLADIPGYRDALAWAEGGWKTAIPADEVKGPAAVYFGADPGQGAAEGKPALEASQVPLKLMAHLKVYDYAKYHELFLKMDDSRVGGGLTNPSIFRGSEDANDLLVLGDVADAAKFRAWLIEDFMTGYPAATGADSGTYRFAVELAAPASPSEIPNSIVRKKFYFNDVFADIMLVHTLNHATFKGAEIGECLAAASNVVEGDADSWRRAWQEQGEKAENAGRQADDRGHGVSAREAYLRAVTYYYHACLAIGVDDPAYRAGVEHYRSVFQRFAALSTPPVQVIGIPYQGTRLPAYFLRPDASGEARPTVVIGDNTSEELYYWVGPPGVERGYNVLLADLPGMGLNTFLGLYFRPDTEVAVGACIDYLSGRGDVDPSRIVFYGGGEPGGWVAVRAAAHEPRIAACVADPYVAGSDAILSVFHRPDVAAVSQGPQTVPGQAEQTARFYGGEPGRGYPRLVAEPQQIRCPLLCLNDPSDAEELRQQAAAAVKAAPNPASRHRVFAPEEGTVLYRQLDNFSLKHRVMFDWLDEVLDQR